MKALKQIKYFDIITLTKLYNIPTNIYKTNTAINLACKLSRYHYF